MGTTQVKVKTLLSGEELFVLVRLTRRMWKCQRGCHYHNPCHSYHNLPVIVFVVVIIDVIVVEVVVISLSTPVP